MMYENFIEIVLSTEEQELMPGLDYPFISIPSKSAR